MTRRAKLLAILLALSVLAPARALAFGCPTQPRGYTFHDASDILTSSLPGHYFERDGLRMDVDGPASSIWPTSEGILDKFANAWICTGFNFPKDPDVDAALGVMFWIVDARNFHVALVWPSGNIGVWRVDNGAFTALQTTRSPDVVGAAADPRSDYQGNSLEAIVIGDRVQVFVNDMRVLSVQGAPPKETWRAGLYAQSGAKKPYQALFYSFETIALPKPW